MSYFYPCKNCNQLKFRAYKELNKAGKVIDQDELGNEWRGHVCPDCLELNRISKLKPKKEVNTSTVLKICKECLVEKPKIFQKKYSSGHLTFMDESGSRWSGETCPSCILKQRRESAHSKGSKPLTEVECLYCKQQFEPGNINQTTCSKICYYRYRNPPKPKVIKEVKPPKPLDFGPRAHCKLFYNICECCATLYTTSMERQRFCGKNCSRKFRNRPSNMSPHRKAKKSFRKKAYNEKRGKQDISKYFIFELIEIYKNKPPGMEVDHIIPLNGENVSGLHVPWNLQYLTPEQNNSKSNKV